MRQRELAATAKSFMLDRPDVSLQELTEHLRSMAEQFLTDASDDYWNGLEVATLVDEKSNLKELAVNRLGFPGECFICELRLPDHRFRWKHNKLFLLLPEEYGPAFPAIVDCYTSPPT